MNLSILRRDAQLTLSCTEPESLSERRSHVHALVTDNKQKKGIVSAARSTSSTYEYSTINGQSRNADKRFVATSVWKTAL